MREGWTYKKLGEVCDKSQNINWNKVSEEKRYTYIDLSSVDRECLSVINPQIINKTNAPSRAKQIVETGDVIFATTRPTLRRTCVIGEDNNGQICSTGFCVLRPQKQVLAKWIFYNLQYDGFYSYIEPLQTGANYPAVADSVVKDYNIPVPSLSEQQSIVAELDKINELINLKKAQLSDLDSLAQSIFYDMFGDPIENEKGWEVKKLGEIAIEKLSYGSGASAVEYDGETRYVRITDITDGGELDASIVSPNVFDNKYLLNDGDILFARSGATVGKTFLYTPKYGRCIYAGYLIRYIPDKKVVLPLYVFALTKTTYYKSFISNSQRAVAQPNINAKQYGDLQIPLPPLSLQQEFAKRIELIEQQKAQISSTIKDLETLLASRMQYWFD